MLAKPSPITSIQYTINPRLASPKRGAPLQWYDPRGWPPWNRFLLAGFISSAIIIAAIVCIVTGMPAVRYPNYSPLEYRLQHIYRGTSFFDHFNYFSDTDPTNGFVVYANRQVAQDQNLTYASETSAILRVDSLTPHAVEGRRSVRIESIATYNTGLFVFDILHTPYGCGTWPALWLTDGYNWPQNGEIDILESTNGGSNGNEITLHTTEGCRMNVDRKETGSPVLTMCESTAGGNSGCGVLGDSSTYGQELNANGGGIYALELRRAGIRVWYFPRGAIPTDIVDSSPAPDPSRWGMALADFPSTECDITSHFRNQSIIVNIDLCGELAAQPQYYQSLYHCPGSCSDFVANNPSSFEKAYWEFASFKVFQAVQPD
ncbi:putative beta-1,3-1,6- / beta-1,3-1,4-glucan hydrolase [Penicillium oxalicum 114-2]|uniref:endo-1,3(4)-beta-glucanase n=1 Tax=Penicillium oxalicum (strain 114-2 / CGMCC 5302) TaxID=933388 RepID=S7ZFJ6_PENO1|nr:putative beta-1,3-1,6- / beta-1,3-1,4-glucan hydrolase [Penicillium oxalicum 114-2]